MILSLLGKGLLQTRALERSCELQVENLATAVLAGMAAEYTRGNDTDE